MTIATTIVLFAVCSFAGWVWESIYAVIRTHKWERRGFLYGPVCPIYGVGVVGILLLVRAMGDVMSAEGVSTYEWWQVFLVAFFGSMILEYVTSWVMEKLFHAYWWDYTGMPLNINGRTCVPAGLLFGGGGMLAVYVLQSAVTGASASVPEVAMQVASYLIVAIVCCDLTLTVNSLTEFQKRVADATDFANERASEMVTDAAETAEEAQARIALERDKLEAATLGRMADSMTRLRKDALAGVRGFRGGDMPERMSRALATIRRRR